MKKSRLTLAAMTLMAVVNTQAQILNESVNTVNDRLYGTSYIPSSYSSDGKAYLVINNDYNYYSEDRQIIIYDDKLNKVKTIDVPEPEMQQPYNVIKKRNVVINVTLTGYSETKVEELNMDWNKGEIVPRTLDEAKAYLSTFGFSVDSTSVVNDSIYLFSFISDYYVLHDGDYNYDTGEYENVLGRKYPSLFYAYLADGGTLSRIYKKYDVSRTYTGEWTEKTETRENIYMRDGHMSLYAYNYNGDITEASGCIDVSQTLFNNDDAYEYIAPVYTMQNTYIYEEDRDEDGVADKMTYYYDNCITAFKIVSDNGNTVQTVNMPENMYMEDMYLYSINDEKYICCSARKMGEYGYYTIFYSIAKGSTRIQQVSEPIKTRVHPTVAGRNETITVELDGNGNGEKEIFVSNAAGQTVYKSKVAAGQKQVQINASGLSRGMNIISVKGNGGKADNNKVIVK